MIRPVFTAALAVLFYCAPLYAADGYYTYRDNKGVIHFSNFYSDKRYKPMNAQQKSRPLFTVERIEKIIRSAAYRHAVDPKLVKAVVKVESDFNPGAVSRAGAQGLMQLMPETSRELNVSNPYDPYQSIDGGVRHLKKMLSFFKGDLKLALAAYNAGKTTVLRYKGIPPYKETKNYVKKVLTYYNQYRRL